MRSKLNRFIIGNIVSKLMQTRSIRLWICVPAHKIRRWVRFVGRPTRLDFDRYVLFPCARIGFFTCVLTFSEHNWNIWKPNLMSIISFGSLNFIHTNVQRVWQKTYDIHIMQMRSHVSVCMLSSRWVTARSVRQKYAHTCTHSQNPTYYIFEIKR